MTKRNEIDPETAFYVQLIFQWVLMGVAIFEIARRLTLLKVPTPREWHRKIVEGKEVVTYKKWGETSVRHGFLVTTMGLNTAITFCKLRMLIGMEQSVCNLDKKRFEITASLSDTG